MALSGFKAQNHPQQVLVHGAKADVDERATTPEMFAPLHRRFRFTVDACALPYNAKLDRFWTPEQDGLAQSWGGERVWCNPPFSDVEPWVRKAWTEIADDGHRYLPGGAELVVMLLPANRTEQVWWQQLVEPYRDGQGPLRVEFLPGRPRFGLGGNSPLPNTRPPFGCCLLIWSNDAGDRGHRSLASAERRKPLHRVDPPQVPLGHVESGVAELPLEAVERDALPCLSGSTSTTTLAITQACTRTGAGRAMSARSAAASWCQPLAPKTNHRLRRARWTPTDASTWTTRTRFPVRTRLGLTGICAVARRRTRRPG